MNGKSEAIVGALFFVGGLAITIVTFSAAEGGGSYVVAWGAILFGFIQMIRGLSRMQTEEADDAWDAAPVLAVPARMIEGGLSMEDYPAAAIRDGAQGKTVVGFTVDETGAVGNVHVASSSGHDALDGAACKAVAERFRFEPARDSNGYALAQDRTQAITWTLPED
jgi:TonB family protein